MKILHITSSYWPAIEFGGPINSVHQLNKFLARQGADITVYTTNAGLRTSDVPNIDGFNFRTSDAQNIDGVKVFYFPYYGYIHWTFSPALFFAIAKNVKNFDIVHITGVWNFPVFVASFWARFYKKPYIISPRGSLMKEPLIGKSSFKKRLYLSLISKRDLEKASVVHFTTEVEKLDYFNTGLSFKKEAIIPNSINVGDFEVKSGKDLFRKKFGVSKNKKIVLFVGRLNWIKGFGLLMPAFAEVIKKNQNIILIIVGGDENNYEETIKKMVKEYKLVSNVIFTGMLTGEEKNSAYLESDIFVLPSYSENFGMALAEAMFFELPVITTKYVGIAPNILKSKAGIIIDKDAGELADAILNLLENASLRAKMGKNGKELVKKEFSASIVADKFLKLYNDICR